MFFISKLVFLSFASVTGLLPLLSHILLFPPTSLAKEYHDEADGAPTITWKRPTSGATFQPGDTLAVEWISDSDIVSPSIRLCEGSTDTRSRRSLREANKHHHRQIRRDSNCGKSIWPEMQKTSNGSQRVDLDLPSVAEPKSYYLLMQDNFGSLMQSPLFSVSSVQDTSSDAASTNAADTVTTASKPTPYTEESGPTNLPAAQAPLSHPSAGPIQGVSPSFNSTAKAIPGIPKGPIYVDSNNLLTHNHPPPVAAFAIPLAAAAAALLIAGGLAIRHCRTRRKEREHDKSTIKILDKLRRSGTHNSSSSTQSTASGNAPQIPPVQIQPIPLFMPMSMPISMEHGSSSATQRASTLNYPKIGEARESTRRAYRYQSPLGPSASNGYSHSLSNDMSCAHLAVSTHASSGRSRTRNLPAMEPYISSSPLSAPCLPPLSFSRSMAKEESSISNRCTTSDILEDYCLPSPRLGSASHDPLGQGLNLPLYSSPIKPPPLPPSLLSAPQRLHIRDEAPTGAPVLPFATHESEHEERLPSRMPTPAGSLYREQRDAYAAIASLLDKS